MTATLLPPSASTPRVIPRDQERPFAIHELFFSTTNLKGIIRSGNEVFRRISGYAEHELIGKPHNIIRHPDMPRCVFALLWSYLRSGRTISAYVKNLAADGCHYWVVALVTPLDRRHLSIRFKPTSRFFPIVQQVYRDILAEEKRLDAAGLRRQLVIDRTTEMLLERLSGLGFPDYDTFMHAFLAEELRNRDAAMQTRATEASASPATLCTDEYSNNFEHLSELLEACRSTGGLLNRQFVEVDAYIRANEALSSNSAALLTTCRTTRLLAMNAQIESTRLARVGAALAIIAQRMGENSADSTARITDVSTAIGTLVRELRQIVFGLSTAKLELEMLTFFVEELRNASGPSDDQQVVCENLTALMEALEQCWHGIAPRYAALERLTARAHQELEGVDRCRRMLEFVHSVGQVEAARTPDGQVFHVILNEVGQHIGSISTQIDGFQDTLRQVRAQLGGSRAGRGQIHACVRGLRDELTAAGCPA